MSSQNVYDFLDKLGITHTETAHTAAMTMDDCVAVSALLGAPFCKNLFLQNRQGTAFYLLLTTGDKPFVTREVSKALGTARLSFGTPEKLMEFLRCAPGSISPMGLMYDDEQAVMLVIDSDLLKYEYFCVHPCDNTESLKIRMEDFLHVVLNATKHTPTII